VAKILPSLNKQFQFDVAYVHNPFQAVGLLRSSERIPYVYVFHAPIPREVEIEAKKGKYGIVTPLVKMANHWIRGKEIYALIYAHKIIVRSRYMEKEMVQLYSDLGRGKTLRIPLCVDTQRFSFAENPTILREQLNLPVHRPVMLTVRRLVPRMGLENLILAMKEIVKQVPEALLLIGGKGYLENSLRTLIMRLQLEANVKLLGFIPEEELPMYYQSADLFVLPTVELEGFGLSTLEALSCGTPVIATPVGANPEVIGPLGQEFLCQDASPESLAERIVWFIKRANSNELRKRCREYCEANFRVDKVVGAIEQVLLEVATGR
jgi:glycosyltransferase involved in cell wall biosynthesis